MANIYGYRYDPHNPNPRALIIPEDCVNYGWESSDPRWNETDLIQQLMHEHDGVDVVYCCCCETPEYREFKMSLEPFEHSMPWEFCSKYPYRSIVDCTVLYEIGVMVTGTLNWQQEILSSLKWKTTKANIIDEDNTYGKLSPEEVSEILRRKYGNMKVKRLTAAQRMTLKMNGIPNTEMKDWYYVKTETESSTGSKSSSKNNDKTRYMVIQNINTNEIRRIEI